MSLQKRWVRERLRSKADPERWMSWLLDFSTEDLGALDPKEWTRLRDEIKSLVKASAPFDIQKLWQDHPLTPMPGFDTEMTKGLRETEDVKRIQEELQNAFQQLIPTTFSDPDYSFQGKWRLPSTIRETRLLSRIGFNQGKRVVRLNPYIRIKKTDYAAWPDLIWLAVVDLMTECGHLLRRCQECTRLFIKKKRQAYCSQRCSQRLRWREWYKKHRDQPEVKARLRQAYRKWKTKPR